MRFASYKSDGTTFSMDRSHLPPAPLHPLPPPPCGNGAQRHHVPYAVYGRLVGLRSASSGASTVANASNCVGFGQSASHNCAITCTLASGAFFLNSNIIARMHVAYIRVHQIAPRDSSLPPVVFHWLPIIGSAIQYGNDPINFFLKCREKVR